MEWLIQIQLPLIESMQAVVRGGLPLFLLKFVIFFAEENVFILTVCALFWLVDRKISVNALCLLLFSEYLNFVLKWSFHQPRPYWLADAIVPLSRQPDFGFPTAYAQDALVFWTYLAWALSRKFGSKRPWALPAIIVPLVSLATVASGANFIHDTLAGLGLGSLILSLVFLAHRFLNTRSAVSPTMWGVMLMLAAPLTQVGLVLLGLAIGPVKIPGLWRRLAMQGTDLPPFMVFSPFDSSMMVGLGAGIFAAGLYLFLEGRGLSMEFRPALSGEAAGVRIFLGLLGLAIVKITMALALDSARDVEVALVFGLGYLSIALWALLGAPFVFRVLEENRWLRPSGAAAGVGGGT